MKVTKSLCFCLNVSIFSFKKHSVVLKKSHQHVYNKLLFPSCPIGRLVTGLVREFLEYFDLDFSIAVFDPETDFVS